MAHHSMITGRSSELFVQRKLLDAGWEVSEPVVDEAYDIVASHSEKTCGRFVKMQIKTARVRDDRSAVVVYAKKNSGDPYSLDDCDYLVGVLNDTAYLIPNRQLSEYWTPIHSIAWEAI